MEADGSRFNVTYSSACDIMEAHACDEGVAARVFCVRVDWQTVMVVARVLCVRADPQTVMGVKRSGGDCVLVLDTAGMAIKHPIGCH